jgi:hypothetical protein
VPKRTVSARSPSSLSYVVATSIMALALFLGLWWLLVTGGDEAPWVLAGLVASVVLLVAFSAREVVMRRARTRHLLEHDRTAKLQRGAGRVRGSRGRGDTATTAMLREILRRSAELTAGAATPEAHLALYHQCQDYISSTEDSLQANNLSAETRIGVRAGQERARALQKHHLLIWARDTSRSLTHEAQKRARTSDKIDTANKAVACLEWALKAYPDEPEIAESMHAVKEFIALAKVAHWVELAERAAFKGQCRTAIGRYQDALFYLTRGAVREEVRTAAEERINKEIELLRERLVARGRAPEAERD